MRSYLRHPSDIPIAIEVDGTSQASERLLKDVSVGGLACHYDRFVPSGSSIHVTISHVDPTFEMDGKVVWCKHCEDHYKLGIEFKSAADELFRLRMVEQICQIEHYRNMVRREQGRILSSEQAAVEWIAQHADRFPGSKNHDAH